MFLDDTSSLHGPDSSLRISRARFSIHHGNVWILCANKSTMQRKQTDAIRKSPFFSGHISTFLFLLLLPFFFSLLFSIVLFIIFHRHLHSHHSFNNSHFTGQKITWHSHFIYSIRFVSFVYAELYCYLLPCLVSVHFNAVLSTYTRSMPNYIEAIARITVFIFANKLKKIDPLKCVPCRHSFRFRSSAFYSVLFACFVQLLNAAVLQRNFYDAVIIWLNTLVVFHTLFSLLPFFFS